MLRPIPKSGFRSPGHGESPLGRPEDFSPEQLAADVRAAVKAMMKTFGNLWMIRGLVNGSFRDFDLAKAMVNRENSWIIVHAIC